MPLLYVCKGVLKGFLDRQHMHALDSAENLSFQTRQDGQALVSTNATAGRDCQQAELCCPVQALDGLKCRRRVLLSGTPMQNHLDEVTHP